VPCSPDREAEDFEKTLRSVLDSGCWKLADSDAVTWASAWSWSEAMEKAVDVYREALVL